MSEPIYKIYKATIKNIDTGNYTVDAVVTTNTIDRDNEIVSTKGFEKGLQEYRKHPVLLSCHDWGDLRKNIGQAEAFNFSDSEVIIKFRYFFGKGNEEADWAFQLAQEGIAAYSIGFIPKEWRKPDDSEKPQGVERVYTDLEILEISQVLIPSNRDALQVRQKMAGIEGELCSQAMQNAKLKFTAEEQKNVIPYKDLGIAPESEDWDGNKEVAAADIDVLRLICTWYDAEKPDVKASYKLPHHRAAGNHPAVWRGVAAAMGALLGARGGVDIPDGDRRRCYNHLVRHYEAFEKESPEFKEYSAESPLREINSEKKSLRGIFDIEGFTEPANEHYHEFRMSKDMNGIIVGQTIWTFSVNKDEATFWGEGIEQHKHLIIARDVTAEMEGHVHEITVFKSNVLSVGVLNAPEFTTARSGLVVSRSVEEHNGQTNSMTDEKAFVPSDKEGRTLSAATLALLQEAIVALEAALGKIKELVDTTMTEEPPVIINEGITSFDSEVWEALATILTQND